MTGKSQKTAFQRAQEHWQTPDMNRGNFAAFAAYQQSKALAATTVRNRRAILTSLAMGRNLLALTLTDLREHVGREGVAAGTRRTERNAIRAFYHWAVEDGLIDVDPSERLAPVRAPRGVPRPFAPEHIDAMLRVSYRRTRAMILLGYYAGFRVASIAAVHGHDIDLAAATIRTHGKGGKDAALPLHPVLAELAATMPTDRYWFPARRDAPGHVRPSSVSDLVRRARIRAGIHDDRLTAHSLRHSFGSHLVELDVDVRVVQELMMHESLATTQIYTAVSERRKREGIAVLPSRPVPTRSERRRAA